MSRPLTELRKADRAKMAAMVREVCEEYGASCEIRDDATHIWADGSRPLPEYRQRLVLSIALGDARLGVNFAGRGITSQPDLFCVPWNVDHHSDAKFSAAFGFAVGASVNPYHRRKCMGFADGIYDLVAALEAAFICINSGEAFMPAAELVEA